MKIGLIGTGAVGQALAKLCTEAGHTVLLGSRTPAKDQVSLPSACADSDMVILAMPYTAAHDTLMPLADTIGDKIVVDATNPLNDDWSPLQLGETTSAGENVQDWLPRARVVKAFNTIFADIMTKQGLNRDGRAATAFIAGNDTDAVDAVKALAARMGLHPVVTGPLQISRHLEAMAHLNIAIAAGQNGGTNAAFLYHQG